MPSLAKLAWELLKDLNREFSRDKVPTWAAAISFFAMLSGIPLLLLIVAGTAQFLGSSQEALNKVMSLVGEASPSSIEVVREVLAHLINVRGALGLVGGFALLWTGSQIFLTLEGALNNTWGVKKRPFWKSRLLAAGFALLLGVLAISSLSLSWVAATLRGTPLLPEAIHEGLLSAMGLALPTLLSFVMFLLLYKVFPNTYVPWKIAALGAGFSATAWELAKQAFGIYLNHMARYASLYGSLAGIVILIVWIYYTSVIVLIGAEIASIVQQKESDSAGTPT